MSKGRGEQICTCCYLLMQVILLFPVFSGPIFKHSVGIHHNLFLNSYLDDINYKIRRKFLEGL